MSFLADLVGNAALTGEKVAHDYVGQQYALERQQHESDLATQRTETIERTKMALAEEQLQAKQKRFSEQSAVVDARAVDVGKSRKAQELLAAGAGNAATITPEQAAVLQQAGRIKGDTAVTAIDDRTTAARENGFYEMEAQLKNSRDATVKALAEEWNQKFKERTEDRKDAELKETGRKADLQYEASRAQTAAYAARQSKSDHQGATEKLTTEKARALQELSILMDKGNRKADGPRIDSIKAYLVELDGLLAERRGSGSKDPAPAVDPAKPASAQMPPSRASQFRVIR